AVAVAIVAHGLAERPGQVKKASACLHRTDPDKNTLPGKRSRTSIFMAVEDFYAVHSNYTTRVVLHVKDSEKEAIGAAAAGNQSPFPNMSPFTDLMA
ncbi:hypothetical protein B296_00042668, partial [Ensete ventricosum]